MPIMSIPVSAIIPTKDRANILKRTLESLLLQDVHPKELIVIDASDNDQSKVVLEEISFPVHTTVYYQKAKLPGAATQRMQGIDIIGMRHKPFYLPE